MLCDMIMHKNDRHKIVKLHLISDVLLTDILSSWVLPLEAFLPTTIALSRSAVGAAVVAM